MRRISVVFAGIALAITIGIPLGFGLGHMLFPMTPAIEQHLAIHDNILKLRRAANEAEEFIQAFIATPAHAQAVNHDAIIASLQDMKQDINRMIALVERHKAASLAVGDEQVNLSGAQLTQIINRYQTLKTGLAAKYQLLP